MLQIIKTTYFASVIVSLSVAFLLTGCGGGGGGGSAATSALQSTNFATGNSTTDSGSAQALETTATTDPISGSVLQSTSFGGLTLNNLAVEQTASGGALTVKLNGTGDADKLFSTGDSGIQTYRMPNAGAGFDGYEVIIPIESGTQIGDATVEAGTAYVNIFTDFATGGKGTATDYLAGGVWLYVPTTVSQTTPISTGAFGYGKQPFSTISTVTGTATYNGLAAGVYSNRLGADTSIGWWDASVSLRADFGTNIINGTVSNVDSWQSNGTETRLSGSLTLGDASIGGANAGFFKGDVSGTVGGRTYAGKWGGQFFGTGQSQPKSVVGTLGGKSESSGQSTNSFVGVFGVYKQ